MKAGYINGYVFCMFIPKLLGLVQQLILSAGGDDDMGTVLGLLQSAPVTDLPLKMDILKVKE